MTPNEKLAAQSQEIAKQTNEEISVGRKMAAKLLGHLGSYDNDRTALKYVGLVGTLLAARVGRPEITFRFGILNSENVNAYATPGGFIFVTKGLLKLVRSESELACILGHEIAHVNEKHMYKEFNPNGDEVSAGESFVRVLSFGSSTLGGSVSKMVDAGMKALLEDGLGKEKEDSADEIGTMYASLAGYRPSGLVTFLRRVPFKKNELGRGYAPFPERLAHLEKVILKNGLKQPDTSRETVLSDRFNRSLSSFSKLRPLKQKGRP